MTTTVLIVLCSLLLLAYVFDISSPRTRIPSVILLLGLGFLVGHIAEWFGIVIPSLAPLLPFFGTVGLILIVLEGSLEVELNRSKLNVLNKSTWMALTAMILMSFALAWIFMQFEGVSFKSALLNAIPFCVISSSVAIPSVRNLAKKEKEIVVYESSLSDIFGVLFFNFIEINDVVTATSSLHFLLQVLLILVISIVCVAGLSWLLSRNKHHITYSPIILLVLLIYALSKVWHLPGLVFILIFGLVLGNLEELKKYKWTTFFHPDVLHKEVIRFREITGEATFVIRAIFFLLFGFLLEASELLNVETLPWALGISIGVILVRLIILFAVRLPIAPLIFIAPRGLITILLFLSIPEMQRLSLVNESLLIQTIIISILIMMMGLMFVKPGVENKVESATPVESSQRQG